MGVKLAAPVVILCGQRCSETKGTVSRLTRKLQDTITRHQQILSLNILKFDEVLKTVTKIFVRAH